MKTYSTNFLKIKISTWLTSIYLLFAPLDFLPVVPGISISKILIFLPLVGIVLYLNRVNIRLDKYLAVLVLYLIVLMISIFYSYDATLSQGRVISIGLNIAVILMLSMISLNELEIRITKRAIAYSGWVTLLLMIFYSDMDSMNGRLTVSVNGYYQDPNYLTGFLIYPTIYYLEKFIVNKKITSIFKVIIFITFVLLTGSRGGLIAILASSIFYIVIWMRANKIKLISVVKFFFISLLVITSSIVILNQLPEDISQRYTLENIENDDGSGRGAIWESIINSYAQSPFFNKVFGWGAGTIGYFTFNGNVGHNIWLESLIEIGVVGTLILLLFYFIFFQKAFRIQENVILASFFGYMIMAMSLSLYSYKPIWNIVLMIMLVKNSSNQLK